MRTNLLSTSVLADCYHLPPIGVYVDVSIGQEKAAIGFAIRKEGWIGLKTFSLPSRQRDPWFGEMEAVRLAQLFFPGETIYCDHPEVARIMGVNWVDRRLNRDAHRAARTRENWCNTKAKAVELPHSRRLLAYANSVQQAGEPESDYTLCQSGGRTFYSGRLGAWVSRGRLHGR